MSILAKHRRGQCYTIWLIGITTICVERGDLVVPSFYVHTLNDDYRSVKSIPNCSAKSGFSLSLAIACFRLAVNVS